MNHPTSNPVTPLSPADYQAKINRTIIEAQRMRSIDPDKPEIDWFLDKFGLDRVAENQILFTFARNELGYELGGSAASLPGEGIASAADVIAAKKPSFAHRNAADMDWDNIPCTPWLHGQRLVRGQVSVLTGNGGIGKTAVTTVVAASLVLGRNLVDPSNTDPRWKLHESRPLKVYLYNLEDDYAESLRRMKALLNHHSLLPADLGHNLEFGDGTVARLIIAIADKKTGVVTRQACLDELIEWLIANGIDVLILDPLIKAHKCAENSNDDMDEVMVLLKEVAIRANVALWLAHHSGKAGSTIDATGSRGATAITGAARVCETMNKPSKAEKAEFGLEGTIVRLDATKANMSAADANSMWLRLEGVAVGNPSPSFPMGDFRQVMTLVHPQGMTDRMNESDFETIFAELRRPDDTGTWGKAKQGKVSAWVGMAFMAAGRSEEQSKLMINEWTANGLLQETQVQNPKTRKNYWGLRLNEIEARRRKESAG